MATCSHCGSEIPEGVKFCINCGAPAQEQAAQTPPRPHEEAVVLDGNAPVFKTSNYFWSMFLITIPVVGLIFLIIWACGGCKNPNLRNFARAMLIWKLIAVVLTIVLLVLAYVFYGAEFMTVVETVETMPLP